MRAAGIFLAVLAAAAVIAAPATAAPTATMRIQVTGTGYERTVTVRLTTPAGKPVRRATVTASAIMRAPGHRMTAAGVRLAESAPGVYRGRLRFVMFGQWVVRVDAAGRTARLTIRL